MKRYYYHISYSAISRGSLGFGMCDMDLDRPIENFDTLVVIKNLLESKYSMSNLVIIAFNLLRVE